MAREFDETSRILENISSRDKEVILLGPIYFWAKYMRRAINSEDFELVVPEVDLDDFVEVLRAGRDVQRQASRDVEGDAVGNISKILGEHPDRQKLFENLTDEEIRSVCWELDEIFENQEFCAWCESWSYYDEVDPEEFAINVADTMLHVRGGRLGISWFCKIRRWKDRQPIIKAILAEKLSGGIGGLLLVGEEVGE